MCFPHNFAKASRWAKSAKCWDLFLVGDWTNPFQTYLSNWIISPNIYEDRKYLKPPRFPCEHDFLILHVLRLFQHTLDHKIAICLNRLSSTCANSIFLNFHRYNRVSDVESTNMQQILFDIYLTKGALPIHLFLSSYRLFPKIGVPQIIHFNRVFEYKPSILGCPYFWKHPQIPGVFKKLWCWRIIPVTVSGLRTPKPWKVQPFGAPQLPETRGQQLTPPRAPQNLHVLEVFSW